MNKKEKNDSTIGLICIATPTGIIWGNKLIRHKNPKFPNDRKKDKMGLFFEPGQLCFDEYDQRRTK